MDYDDALFRQLLKGPRIVTHTEIAEALWQCMPELEQNLYGSGQEDEARAYVMNEVVPPVSEILKLEGWTIDAH